MGHCWLTVEASTDLRQLSGKPACHSMLAPPAGAEVSYRHRLLLCALPDHYQRTEVLSALHTSPISICTLVCQVAVRDSEA